MRPTTIVTVVLLVCIIAVAIYFFVRRKTQWPVGKPCSVCGAESGFGYDKHAEDLGDIKPMCLKCLATQLEKEYAIFAGRAVVIQPVAGLPSYVFQAAKGWGEAFKDSKIGEDVCSLLASMEPKCRDCGQNANYLWVESAGLNSENFGDTLDRGLSQTLLPRNPKPISLCSKCCVGHITRDLESKHLTYGEVCSPGGEADGFVVPMAY